jgi:glycosyltransferase involved in cell wall biosynthesis
MNHYVFFSRTLPFHGVGGMEVLIWDLMTEIVRSGQGKVTVVTTTIPSKPNNFEDEGINIVAIPGVTPRRYTPKWWSLSADYFDNNLRAKCDCVVSVAMGAAGLLFQRKKFSDVPIICQSHGTVLSETISKLRTRNPIQILKCLRQIKYFIREYRVFKHSNKIVAAGGIVDSTLRKFPYNRYINSNKVTLIENGINIEEFCPSFENRKALREKYNITMDVPVVVSVARLIKQKGVEQAVYAFKELVNTIENAHFLVIGDGRERQPLERLVKELDLVERVTFVGSVQYAELPKYYQMSDVIVFPTLRMEGAPLNILEALSVGLPVVASNFLTNSRHISKYINFVEPRNPAEVANALAEAIRVSQQEDISLSKIYSIPEMTKIYLRLFEDVKRAQL